MKRSIFIQNILKFWKEMNLHSLFISSSFYISITLARVIFLCWHDMLGNYAGIQTWIYYDFNNLHFLLRLCIVVDSVQLLRETLKRKTTRQHLGKLEIQILKFMGKNENGKFLYLRTFYFHIWIKRIFLPKSVVMNFR